MVVAAAEAAAPCIVLTPPLTRSTRRKWKRTKASERPAKLKKSETKSETAEKLTSTEGELKTLKRKMAELEALNKEVARLAVIEEESKTLKKELKQSNEPGEIEAAQGKRSKRAKLRTKLRT